MTSTEVEQRRRAGGAPAAGRGHEARGRRAPRVRRRPGEGLLRRPRLAARRGLPRRRRLPRRPAHAARLASARSSSATASRPPRPARSRACSSPSRTSTRPARRSSARGAEVSEVFHDAGGVFHHGGTDGAGRRPGARARSLRLVRLVRRSGRQRLDPAGDHHAAARARGGRTTAYASVDDLAQALRRAAAAHGEHEARTGEADADWPDWYAAVHGARARGRGAAGVTRLRRHRARAAARRASTAPARSPRAGCASRWSSASWSAASAPTGRASRPRRCCGRARRCTPRARRRRPREVDVAAALAWRDFMVSELLRRGAGALAGGAGHRRCCAGAAGSPGPARSRSTACATPPTHVVLANGADPFVPPVPGLRELDGVWTNREVTGDAGRAAPAARPRRRRGRGRDGAGRAPPRRRGGRSSSAAGTGAAARARAARRGARRGAAPRRHRAGARRPARPRRGARATTTCSSSTTGASCAATGCWSRRAGGRGSTGSGWRRVGIEPDAHGVPVDARLSARRAAVGDRRRHRAVAADPRRQVPGRGRRLEHPRRAARGATTRRCRGSCTPTRRRRAVGATEARVQRDRALAGGREDRDVHARLRRVATAS